MLRRLRVGCVSVHFLAAHSLARLLPRFSASPTPALPAPPASAPFRLDDLQLLLVLMRESLLLLSSAVAEHDGDFLGGRRRRPQVPSEVSENEADNNQPTFEGRCEIVVLNTCTMHMHIG